MITIILHQCFCCNVVNYTEILSSGGNLCCGALAQFLLWNNAFWGLDKMFHEMYAPSYNHPPKRGRRVEINYWRTSTDPCNLTSICDPVRSPGAFSLSSKLYNTQFVYTVKLPKTHRKIKSEILNKFVPK